jgi:hypothetical protein
MLAEFVAQPEETRHPTRIARAAERTFPWRKSYLQ